MIQASGRITGNANWNDYKTAGVYKVQNCNMVAGNNAPVGLFAYGILVVTVSETEGEKRTLQIFYPDQIFNGIVMARRMHDYGNAEGVDWRPWYAVSGTLLG